MPAGDREVEQRRAADLADARERHLRISVTCGHVEHAWACVMRPVIGTPVYAITVNDIVRGFAIVHARDMDATARSWVDIPTQEISALGILASTVRRSPAIIIVRFNDSILFVNQHDAGADVGLLCGSDGELRTRLALNRMSPVRYESRWT